MKKLSRDDIKRVGDLETRLRDSYAELESSHDKIADAIAALNEDINRHNEIIEEAAGVRDDLVREMDDYFSDKTEKWQEGDNGQAYSQWKQDWEELDLDPLEHVEVPPLPEGEHASVLESAPQEPGGS